MFGCLLVFMVISGCVDIHDNAIPWPTITILTPDNGPESGGTEVTITGAYFLDGELLDVEFGTGNSATGVTFMDSTIITCTTPAGSGMVDVIITRGDGQQATMTDGFTYNQPPAAFACNPKNGADIGGTLVTVTGSNFLDGPSLNVEFSTSNSATGVTFVDSTTITCTTPAGTSTVDVIITSGDGQQISMIDSYKYSPITPSTPDIRLDTDTVAEAHSKQPKIAVAGTNVYSVWNDERNGSNDVDIGAKGCYLWIG
jgi:hypothetical protein